MKLLAQGTINDYCQVIGHIGYPAYIVKGHHKIMMIDAGINLLAPKYYTDLSTILGDPHKLNYAAITHSHYDHLGAIPYLLKKIPGLTIVGAERIQQLLAKQSVIDFMTHLSNIQRPLFADITGQEDVSLYSFNITLPVKDGDTIDLGGLTCIVYEVPGHTRDSLAYYFPQIKMLCPGEAVGVPQGMDEQDVQVEFLSSYEEYFSSLEKMASLEVKILCMAHGFVYTDDDVASFFRASLKATAQYKNLLLEYLDKVNGDIAQAIELITKEEYDKKGTIHQERNAYISNLSAQVKLVAKDYQYIKG
ncbi:MAG: MBL fold metallo-hydrolase [Spirochaetota bacterium]|nr:MBL fold metallo-hydrolase [Spirochaetota bacterium]